MASRLALLVQHRGLDARIWGRFRDHLSTKIAVETLPDPPPISSTWSADLGAMDEEARQVAEDQGGVAVAVGANSGAAAVAHLVSRGLAGHGVLVNPAETLVTGFLEEFGSDFGEPDLDDEGLERMAAAMERLHDLMGRGEVDKTEARRFVDDILPGLEELPPEDRELVARVQADSVARVGASAACSMGSESDVQKGAYDWIARTSEMQDRVTVAITQQQDKVARLVSRRAPSMNVIELDEVTEYPWLENPDRMVDIVVAAVR